MASNSINIRIRAMRCGRIGIAIETSVGTLSGVKLFRIVRCKKFASIQAHFVWTGGVGPSNTSFARKRPSCCKLRIVRESHTVLGDFGCSRSEQKISFALRFDLLKQPGSLALGATLGTTSACCLSKAGSPGVQFRIVKVSKLAGARRPCQGKAATPESCESSARSFDGLLQCLAVPSSGPLDPAVPVEEVASSCFEEQSTFKARIDLKNVVSISLRIKF